ncbi:hypothetical protein [Tautonia rosea]|uniref:hypothetical protein n=1 Tax=Tautonia rosea TaxID=2728037 RepID=UPI0014756C8E|nr:hypothetical protein [Tautonia rosea]
MFSCFCRSGFPTPFSADDPAEELQNPTATALNPSPGRSTILGKVVFQTHRGEPAEAILDHQGRWCCPQLPVLDRVLNILYEPGRVPGGNLPFGYAELIRVAAWLKGHVSLPRS